MDKKSHAVSDIAKCLNSLRDFEKDGIWKIRRENLEKWNKLRRRMTKLCQRRLEHIIKAIPMGITAHPPDSPSASISNYLYFISLDFHREYDYDTTLSYARLFNYEDTEFANFQYQVGEEDGLAERANVDIPTKWLVCDDGELKKVVLCDLADYLDCYIREKEEQLSMLHSSRKLLDDILKSENMKGDKQ